MPARNAYAVAMSHLQEGCLVVCTPIVHTSDGQPDVAVSSYQPIDDDDSAALEVASDGTMAAFLLGVMGATRKHLDARPGIACR